MLSTRHHRKLVDYKKRRKSLTLPDQSMSIQEIVRRYVKGIPIDVVQRRPVYTENTGMDLEQMSRMDFADKAALADEMRLEAEGLKEQLIANDDQRRKERKAAIKAKKAKAQGSDIAPLDNTMSVDTKLTKN